MCVCDLKCMSNQMEGVDYRRIRCLAVYFSHHPYQIPSDINCLFECIYSVYFFVVYTCVSFKNLFFSSHIISNCVLWGKWTYARLNSHKYLRYINLQRLERNLKGKCCFQMVYLWDNFGLFNHFPSIRLLSPCQLKLLITFNHIFSIIEQEKNKKLRRTFYSITTYKPNYCFLLDWPHAPPPTSFSSFITTSTKSHESYTNTHKN